tara:strand:- start:14 stop:145 length:132 start_codon:yes stop_codon:yes gene_type:complete
MAKRQKKLLTYISKKRKKRPGVHSKNASKGQSRRKKKYRGQGR